MSDITNYRGVTIPEDTPPSEYSYVERRAEILSLIEEAGHPGALNQTQLAGRYDTSQSNISKDFDRLREYIRDTLGHQRHAISAALYRKAIKQYTDNGEYDKAIEALESWNEWLREEGARDTEPPEHQLSGEMSVVEFLSGDGK
jgi:hypothetical protein